MPQIIYLDSVKSTNSYLKELLLENKELEEGTVIVSNYQTKGKGQSANIWESEKGKNILLSILLRPTIKANQQFLISQLTSLAIKSTLNKYVDDISIKWSNDIYHLNEKICGILIEHSIIGDAIDYSIIGIGVNINQENFLSDAPNPCSLKTVTEKDYDIASIINELIAKLKSYYKLLEQDEKDKISGEYKKALYRNEGYHLYRDSESEFKATIKDVLSSGMLVLEREDGKLKEYAFKEISYIIR